MPMCAVQPDPLEIIAKWHDAQHGYAAIVACSEANAITACIQRHDQSGRAIEAVCSTRETFSFLRRPLETLSDAEVASCSPLHV
jgi:hypothetical protein